MRGSIPAAALWRRPTLRRQKVHLKQHLSWLSGNGQNAQQLPVAEVVQEIAKAAAAAGAARARVGLVLLGNSRRLLGRLQDVI